MTANEIKKALECCKRLTSKNCKNCPYVAREGNCIINLFNDILDLINQYEGKIRRLEAEVEMFDYDIDNLLKEMGVNE